MFNFHSSLHHSPFCPSSTQQPFNNCSSIYQTHIFQNNLNIIEQTPTVFRKYGNFNLRKKCLGEIGLMSRRMAPCTGRTPIRKNDPEKRQLELVSTINRKFDMLKISLVRSWISIAYASHEPLVWTKDTVPKAKYESRAAGADQVDLIKTFPKPKCCPEARINLLILDDAHAMDIHGKTRFIHSFVKNSQFDRIRE